jgi:lysophospholipase L1-like esterase
LSNDETKSRLALKSFKLFSKYMEENLPETKVFFLAIKPSIKRWNYWPKLVDANNKIKNFIDKHDLYYYVDTASEMLDEKDVVLQDIFLEDKLHMNAKGYKLWTDKLKPILLEHYTD